jgi:adenosylcobinamide amidohydrolase
LKNSWYSLLYWKSKLILTQPDVKAYSGILSKFGYETWNVLRESVKTLYKVDKDEE